jgi:preprotein translocase subunit SecG
MVLAVSTGWVIGWIVGALVVVIAAALLITIILLGRQIARQADDITAALGATRENTSPLFEVKRTNLALDRITRGLRGVRTGGGR